MDPTPYISIASPPAPLAAGAVLAAIVQEILADGVYKLLAQNVQLQLTIPLPLEVGQRVTLKVRSATPKEIVFDLAVPRETRPERTEARTLLERLELPPTPENEQLVRAFVRMNAPIDRALLTAVRAETPPKAEAAAFLAAHGIEPTQEAVDRIAALVEEPLAPPATPSLPLLTPLAPPDPLPAIQSPPADAPLREILDRSPRLRILDRLIQLVEQTPPAADAPEEAEPILKAIRTIEQLVARPPQDIEEAIARLRPLLARLPAASLKEIRAFLERTELAHFSQIPALEEARASRGTVFEWFDRLMTYRLVNQLSSMRNEGIGIYQLALPVEGRMVQVPIRVVRRDRGKRGDRERPAGLSLDADFSNLGRVRTWVECLLRTLTVRFHVRDASVRDHLLGRAAELVDALRALGFEATVGAELSNVKSDSPLSAFATDSPYVSVDLRI